jgi:predicted N-acyltransferase
MNSIGVASLMQQLVAENKLSSVHVNFMRKEEISPYLTAGYKLRETIQYR